MHSYPPFCYEKHTFTHTYMCINTSVYAYIGTCKYIYTYMHTHMCFLFLQDLQNDFCKIFIVIQLQLYVFSPHPSTLPHRMIFLKKLVGSVTSAEENVHAWAVHGSSTLFNTNLCVPFAFVLHVHINNLKIDTVRS